MTEAATGDVFYKKSVLKTFSKSTGKHPCQCLFFNKVAGLRPIEQLQTTASKLIELFVKIVNDWRLAVTVSQKDPSSMFITG